MPGPSNESHSSRTTLVRFGAKEAALIVDEGEWWRLFSPIMVHAGILHILPNVAIQVPPPPSPFAYHIMDLLPSASFSQLRVGGYLNLVFGTFNWFFIYLISGVFGELMRLVVQ
jgi:rhomboid protease GluP